MRPSETFKLVTRNTAEVITKDRLKRLLEEAKPLKGYIGVEPSGLFHVGWMIWASKLKDLMDAGIEMTFLEATWHAQINDKMGGSLEKLRKCAKYLEHCLASLNVDMDRLRTVQAEEFVADPDYWALVLKVSKRLTLARIKRAITIMGRSEKEASTDFSKLIYPAMQVADIFYQDLDVCLGGMDQRRAHALAIEVADKISGKKPVAIHTPLLAGLSGSGRMDASKKSDSLLDGKMSKSKPETCLFIHDREKDVEKKILNAFCPPKQVPGNPVIEIIQHILFAEDGLTLRIERPERFGGEIEIENLEELLKMYRAGDVHPLDLKRATAKALNKRLDPVRRYFEENDEAKRLYEEVKSLTVTR